MDREDKRALELASHAAQPLSLMGMDRLGNLHLLVEDLEEFYHESVSGDDLSSKIYQFVRDQQAMEGGEV
jgi:hypothetical protein